MNTATARASDAVPGLAPVTGLPGVGEALAQALTRLGIERVQDLWFHLPLRYEDRTRITPIRDARVGTTVQVEGVVEAVERGFRYRPQLRVAIGDGSRATLTLRFFHFNRNQAAQLVPGVRLVCFGEVRHGTHGPEMVHPEYRRVATDAPAVVEQALTPVYPSTEGLGLFIHQASSTYDPAGVFAGIAILLAFVTVANALATRLERRLLRWRPRLEHQPATV